MTLSDRHSRIVALVREYHAAQVALGMPEAEAWPSDRWLARRLGVSRSTVRVHVATLAERGFCVGAGSPVRLTPG